MLTQEQKSELISETFMEEVVIPKGDEIQAVNIDVPTTTVKTISVTDSQVTLQSSEMVGDILSEGVTIPTDYQLQPSEIQFEVVTAEISDREKVLTEEQKMKSKPETVIEEIVIPTGDRVEHACSGDAAQHLRGDVGRQFRRGESTPRHQTDRHSRIQMAARDVADRVSHGDYAQAKRERHAEQTDADLRKPRGDYGAAASGKCQPKCTDRFCGVFLRIHDILPKVDFRVQRLAPQDDMPVS